MIGSVQEIHKQPAWHRQPSLEPALMYPSACLRTLLRTAEHLQNFKNNEELEAADRFGKALHPKADGYN